MKIPNKAEIKQIATTHSGDIDYKDFMKIYMKCTKESYSFLTIDNTLLANNPLRLKLFSHFIKMISTDEVKILDDKIKVNQAQYDLCRKAAKISALSSKELDKYKYFSFEDFGYKPGVVKQAKFQYSPFSNVFNKDYIYIYKKRTFKDQREK